MKSDNSDMRTLSNTLLKLGAVFGNLKLGKRSLHKPLLNILRMPESPKLSYRIHAADFLNASNPEPKVLSLA